MTELFDDVVVGLGSGAVPPDSTLSAAAALEDYSARVLPALALAPDVDLAAAVASVRRTRRRGLSRA